MEILYNLKDKVIKWPNKNEKKKENMKNNNSKGFLDCVRKIDSTNIILKYKPRSIYNKEIFYI